MRIALVEPVKSLMPPLNLMILAAVLEARGYEVTVMSVYDRQHSPGYSIPKIFSESLDRFRPDLIGIGFLSAEREPAQTIVEQLRCSFREAIIVAGGRHPSSFPLEVLGWGADFVVVGEGETALLELVESLNDGRPTVSIEGVARLDQNGVIRHVPRQSESANLDITPSYHLVPYQKYIDARSAVIGRYFRAGWLMTSRGCFSKCIYCRDPRFGGRLRFRSMKAIVDDIRIQLDNYSLECFYIIDDMFAISESRVIEFCQEFKKMQEEYNEKLYFAATARTDKLTPQMVEAMKSAGCIQLSIGVESGSQRVLDFLQTGKRVDSVVPAFTMLKSAGIDTFVNFIVGVPGEDDKDFQETLRLARTIRPDTVGVSFLTPYPGTPLFQLSVARGWLSNAATIVFKHSDGLPKLDIGVSVDVLLERRKTLLRTTWAKTFWTTVSRPEFIGFAAELFVFLLFQPRLLLNLLKSLLVVDIDKFKELAREAAVERAGLSNP